MTDLHMAPQKTAFRLTSEDGVVRLWLIGVGCLVFAMVIVGGATRLTDSGLSITEWLPLLGAIPPLSELDWHTAFEKYKQIPEYTQVNKGMSLDEFKYIYWWEWSHRFLGRFIGIAFALPLLVFWLAGRLRPGLGLKLLGVLALGALQGFIGWYMVMSGLVDRVDVSHYRLALHLTTAFLILVCITWLVLSLAPEKPQVAVLKTLSPAQANMAMVISLLLFLQVVLGAFVAGTDAGLVFNTWPLMDGQIFPDGLLDLSPWYLNPLENIITMQFNHRLVAYGLLILAMWHAISLWRTCDDDRLVRSSIALALVLLAQATIGVWTLLAVPDAGGIPIGLGLVHQGGAAIVVVIATWHFYRISKHPRAA